MMPRHYDARKLQPSISNCSPNSRLLALTSQGRHDVRQSDAEVVFLDVLKNREIQRILLCELSHHSRRGTSGHPMPVDRRRRIAGAQRHREAPIVGRLRRVDGVDAQQPSRLVSRCLAAVVI